LRPSNTDESWLHVTVCSTPSRGQQNQLGGQHNHAERAGCHKRHTPACQAAHERPGRHADHAGDGHAREDRRRGPPAGAVADQPGTKRGADGPEAADADAEQEAPCQHDLNCRCRRAHQIARDKQHR
jgi:hypothetical protein